MRSIRSTRGFSRLTALACVVIASLTVLLEAAVAASGPSATEVRAAYLFNFARYVEWPVESFADESSPVRICVLGDRSFVDIATTSINGRKVSERDVVVEPRSTVLGARDCHILFVVRSGEISLREVVSTLKNKSVMTVSDTDGFAKMGGIANFVTVDNKVRFAINPEAANQAGLKISSRLLRIAQVVD